MNSRSDKEISWKTVSGFRKEYVLASEGKNIGILKRKNIFSGSASGEVNDKSLTFVSYGGFNRTIEVHETELEKKIADIDLKWYGNNNGILRLASGNEYVWKCIDFFRGQWGWQNKENQNILLFKPENLLNKSGTIKLYPGNEAIDDVGILILLGLHLKLFFNYWIIIAIIVIVAVLRGR